MIDYVIKKPITTMMLFISIVLVGIISFTRIPVDLFPDMQMPFAVVMATYNGAGPQEIEELVTRPLEGVVSTVSNLKSMQSTSSNGSSMIMLEFTSDANMDFATLNIREKVDMVKDYLPEGVGDILIMKADPSQMPIMAIGFYSDEYDLVKLKSFIDDNVTNRIERINGVASVSLSGGKEEEILVTVMPEKMNTFGISLAQLRQVLMAENLNLPGGELLQGDSTITLRTVGEFKSTDDILNLPINTKRGLIYLRDIATVERTYKDMSAFAYINGKPCIAITIQKQSTANTVKVAAKVNKEIKALEEEYKEQIATTTILDSAEFINEAIDNVSSSALLGGILAVIILYLFLRKMGTTMIIAVSIPISIIGTFVLMDFNGISLNMISLGGLTLAVGMLVDSSIVVLENIDRHKKLGLSPNEAASIGAKEVAMAITASTLTSVAVFLPFIFTEGMITAMLHELAWVVTYSLLFSLLVALTLVPMLSAHMSERLDRQTKFKPARMLTKLVADMLGEIENFYDKVLGYAVHHRRKVIMMTGIYIIGGFVLLGGMKKELFPASDEGTYTVSVETKQGTPVEKTLEILQMVETKIREMEEVKDIILTAGSSGGMGGMSSVGSNVGSLTVDIGPANLRSIKIEDSIKNARAAVSSIAGCEVEISASSSSAMTSAEPINLEISGLEVDKLQEVGDDFILLLSNIDGVVEARKSSGEGNLEANVVLDRSRMSMYGLTTSQVAQAIQTAVQGSRATAFKVDGDEIDVTLKVDDTNVKYIKDATNIFVESPMGENVPLTELGEIIIETAPSNISRKNQNRVLNISAKLNGTDLGTAQVQINEALESYNMPVGYTWKWAGDIESMIETFTSLATALFLAGALVYMVMASQFESLQDPFIILMTIPLAFIGSIYGLFFTGQSLNVTSLIGLIVLCGIVVNNGIVLIDYMNQLREKGIDLISAVMAAGKTRLRPILMTTLTTVLGMLPMAIGAGEGTEITQGMGITIITGLSLATVLTLVVVPVIYIIFEHKRENKRIKKEQEKAKKKGLFRKSEQVNN